MTRRTLICNIDAGVERPEYREFKFNPIAAILADRGSYLAAALTIARAYSVSNEKVKGKTSIVSYGEWSRFVREPLIWLLGEGADPVKSMDQAYADDPEKSAARGVLELLSEVLDQGRAYKAHEIIRIANETTPAPDGMNADRPSFEHAYPELRNLLVAKVGTTNGREIDARRFGKWLGRLNGQIHGSWKIVKAKESRQRGDDWVLVAVSGGASKVSR